ncbi:MAG: hypothetical protein ACP5M0_05925 [Desulfomonilaceae bacterium]
MRKILIIGLIVITPFAISGCISCIPQYAAPPEPPPSACYPTGHDPFVPMDHNPTAMNPWDLFSSLAGPLLYGPPR